MRFLLGNGLLRCGRCGAAMRVKSENKPSGRYEVYWCHGRHSGATVCDQSAVNRAAVDSAVLEHFEQMGLDVEETRREFASRSVRTLAQIGQLREQAERQLARTQASLEKVERDYLEGELPAADYTRLSERLQSELQASRQDAARLAAREREVAEAGVLEDVELLTRLTALRATIAGEIRGASEDVRATQAAIRRVFVGFVLLDSDESLFGSDFPETYIGYVLQPLVRPEMLVPGQSWGELFRVPLELPELETPANP